MSLTMTVLHLLAPTVSTRPLPPPPLPTALGETMRGLVLVGLLVLVCCTAFVADRLRRDTPRPVHMLLWGLTAVVFGLAAGVVANVLTIPPTAGIYFTAVGSTVGAAFAGWAALNTWRDTR